MKWSFLLAPVILGGYAYAAVHIQCTGKSDEAFRQPEFTGGEYTLANMAKTQAPKSYTSLNQTWISEGFYNFALTVPRGTKAIASDYCGCINGMKQKMKSNNMMLCRCQFGQSTVGIGEVPKIKQQNQKREYMEPEEAASLWTRARKKKGKHNHKGVGAIQMPSC